MFTKFLQTIFVFNFFYNFALAKASLAEQFQLSAKQTIQSAKSLFANHMDHPYIETLNKLDLLNNTIKYVVLDNFNKPEQSTRFAAYYSAENKTIYINQAYQFNENLIGALSIHELFGIAKIYDLNYENTLGLLYLSQANLSNYHRLGYDIGLETNTVLYSSETAPIKTLILSGKIKAANSRLLLAANGGGLSDGGGGDPDIIDLKLALIDRIKSHYADTQNIHTYLAYSFVRSLSIEQTVLVDKTTLFMAPENNFLIAPELILVSKSQLTENLSLVVEDLFRIYKTINFEHFEETRIKIAHQCKLKSPGGSLFVSSDFPKNYSVLHPDYVKKYFKPGVQKHMEYLKKDFLRCKSL